MKHTVKIVVILGVMVAGSWFDIIHSASFADLKNKKMQEAQEKVDAIKGAAAKKAGAVKDKFTAQNAKNALAQAKEKEEYKKKQAAADTAKEARKAQEKKIKDLEDKLKQLKKEKKPATEQKNLEAQIATANKDLMKLTSNEAMAAEDAKQLIGKEQEALDKAMKERKIARGVAVGAGVAALGGAITGAVLGTKQAVGEIDTTPLTTGEALPDFNEEESVSLDEEAPGETIGEGDAEESEGLDEEMALGEDEEWADEGDEGTEEGGEEATEEVEVNEE